VARRAWYQARGETAEWIEAKLSDNPDEEGVVVGDEMRLRQIVTNLAR
jgi:osomolarity two-component system, sensor histidine kinase SLN1